MKIQGIGSCFLAVLLLALVSHCSTSPSELLDTDPIERNGRKGYFYDCLFQANADSISYSEAYYELRNRERWGVEVFDSSLKDFNSECLMKILEVHIDAFRKGWTLHDYIGKKGDSLSDKSGIVGPDSRIFWNELIDTATFVKAASATVLILPNSIKYGEVKSNIYYPKRKLINDFLPKRTSGNFRFDSTLAFDLGTRTGTLVGNNIVVTAGHGLKKGDTVIVLRSFYDHNRAKESDLIDSSLFRLGDVVYVRFGGTYDPDIAVIKLRSHFSKPGLSLPTQQNFPILGSGSALFASGHPWGMPMIVDSAGSILDINFHGLKSEHYFFADLDMNMGNSGTPVFQVFRNSSDSIDSVQWIGIVVGSGGMDDFICHSGYCWWNMRTPQSFIGTRVLSLKGVIDEIQSAIKNPEQAAYMQSSNCNCSTQIKGDSIVACLNQDTVFLHGRAIVIKNKHGILRTIEIGDSTLVHLEGCKLIFWENRGLRSVISPEIVNLLEFHKESWPTGIMKNAKYTLRFKYQVTSPLLAPPTLPANQKYNLLDGIGIADIIDELPTGTTVLRQMTWFCDGQYMELSVDRMYNGNIYQQPIIGVKTIVGQVPSYPRTMVEK